MKHPVMQFAAPPTRVGLAPVRVTDAPTPTRAPVSGRYALVFEAYTGTLVEAASRVRA